MKKVMIGTPTISGNVWANYQHSLIESMVLAAKHGWVTQTNLMSGNSLINSARAIICQDFMDSDCDCLFFIDSDLQWDPEGFVRLIEAPVDVIGGAYPIKKDGPVEFHIKVNGKAPKSDGRPILVETTKIGGGFVKITREAIKRMQQAYPDVKAKYRGRDIYMLWDPLIVDGNVCGEDYSFCERWTRIQGKIYVWPDIDFGHYGMKSWHGNFLKDVLEKEMKHG